MIFPLLASLAASAIFLSKRGFGLSVWERAMFVPIVWMASLTVSACSLSLLGLPLSSALVLSSGLMLSLSAAWYVFPQKKAPSGTDRLGWKIPLAVFLTALAICLALFSKFNNALVGADATRFAYVAETAYLKDSIPLSLRPYDIADSYFYFPIPLFFPSFFGHAGANPMDALTITALILASLSAVSFLMFSYEAFSGIGPRRRRLASAISAFAYLIAFNVPLSYLAGRGVVAYLIAWHFFISGAFAMMRLANNPKSGGSRMLIAFSVLGLFLTHWYLVIGLLVLALSVLASLPKGRHRDFFSSAGLPAVLAALAAAPLLATFLLSSGNPLSPEKVSGWKYGEYELEQNSRQYLVLSGLFKDPAIGPVFGEISFAYVFGLAMCALFLFRSRFPRMLSVFFLASLALSLALAPSLTHKRVIDYLRICYPLGIALFFLWESERFKMTKAVLFGIAIISLLASPFASAWVVAKLPEIDAGAFDIVTDSEKAAFEFISSEVRKDAVFLTDGPGAGCIGGQSGSHGERIFPITGRRVFLFTNYCWANYDVREFSEMVDSYRRISINPDDSETLAELKGAYGVTHVYIGPKSVGLDRTLFALSGKYSRIFSSGGVEIFEIL